MYVSKQMIVMRRDLKMRKGKIAAQASHACIEAVLMALKKEDLLKDIEIESNHISINSHKKTALTEWFDKGIAKVCVYVDSEKELLDIHQKALSQGIISALIQDAGFTEFHGEPTYTCLAFEPLEKELADRLTGHLPLY
ncbi:aminoacyl-tRNA hydrolase [Eggerthia catenaformis]|uniref:aminoacyl-tRNA hydrolase n=1 Tax=Eggerthia catenaformis TaxID=31973 RepID=UPI00248E55E8|nr:aminoacyl-tRNA hydrolase [Eggerthia catenaformis]